MMMSAKLQMRQSQSLVMTPQLLQSIRLLQFSHLELQAFVDQEMERNPLLETGDGAEPDWRQNAGAEPPDLAQTPVAIADAALSGERHDGEAIADGFEAGGFEGGGFEEPAPGDRETPSTAKDASSLSPASPSGGGGGESFDGAPSIESFAEPRPSLARHALSELAEAIADPLDRRIGEALVEQLDEAGYLRIDPEAVAEALGVEPQRLRGILRRLQDQSEPAGLFALDLADCLAIQLRRLGRLDPVMETVLAHLDLLARRDFATLRRLTSEDETGLMDILSEIRRLDPKPGHAFESGPADVVVPDVVVTEAADGSWRIELNPDALPRVLVDSDYVERIATGRLSSQDRTFLTDCHASANWLVRSLDQRARTILKVASEIVRRQDGFLTRGIEGLKPLTLMAVAEAVGMHESTISRVTANKYIATPRGTFELKFFFTVAIASTGGGDPHSAESVKHRIRILVQAESIGAVLSDDDIADKLKAEGVELARRTVAKYREALGIPSSIQRRREMNARRAAS
ncbi:MULTISPECIES: RNA polymerase factor sigma-54 [unclassified Aureimonas]|uniref:RNA polymerase factor sigma-54 n=1 Tax=unclassified Aureimonas TaxID=2615206 RepID=UPI0006F92F12|nr:MULTISPECIES: RNA polymerase factor sigma-54 [unclassified Aureimonas]KQT64542.1 RNA polymerase sigma-54 factor [Aureimonas sp. Leaf427]KQT81727.1 RNA polymerase sigma-54 factor [Aureimonas sp. Leaf460]